MRNGRLHDRMRMNDHMDPIILVCRQAMNHWQFGDSDSPLRLAVCEAKPASLDSTYKYAVKKL